MTKLQDIIDEVESEIFGDFCRKIRISNIQEYEDRQLKAAQEESEARLRFDSQISRLTHQYAPSHSSMPFISDRSFHRIKFSQEQLSTTQSRLQRLDETVQKETSQLQKLQKDKKALEKELGKLEADLEGAQEELKELQKDLDEKTNVLESAKRGAIKASKENDRAQKEISSMVSIGGFFCPNELRSIATRILERRNFQACHGTNRYLSQMPIRGSGVTP